MVMPNKPRSVQLGPHAQRGAVLVVALIFLILLTILAISASGRSLLQERMAGGLHNAQQAEMSAQTALRGAEWWLWIRSVSNPTTPFSCGTGIFTDCYTTPTTDVVNFRTKQGWVTTGATEYEGYAGSVDYTSASKGGLAHNPWYIIEDLGPVSFPGGGAMHESTQDDPSAPGSGVRKHIYRITARATGGSANTVRVQGSTFLAPGN